MTLPETLSHIYSGEISIEEALDMDRMKVLSLIDLRIERINRDASASPTNKALEKQMKNI